jgi:hypothetical protein
MSIGDLRAQLREVEGQVMSHIVYNMNIAGAAATRLLNALDTKKGPTLFLFQCLTCQQYHFHIDRP